MMTSPFEDFKNKERKGDLLLRLIVTDILLRRGVKRADVGRYVNPFVSNAHLAKVFDHLTLQFHPDDISHNDSTSNPDKRKGNTVEHLLWETFEQNGYAHTVGFYEQFVNSNFLNF